MNPGVKDKNTNIDLQERFSDLCHIWSKKAIGGIYLTMGSATAKASAISIIRSN